MAMASLLARRGPSKILVLTRQASRTPRFLHLILEPCPHNTRGYASQSQAKCPRQPLSNTSKQKAPVSSDKGATFPTAKKVTQNTALPRTNAAPSKAYAKPAAVKSAPVPRPLDTRPGQGKPQAKEDQEKTTEEQLAEIDRYLHMTRSNPTVDPWGFPIETLGVFSRVYVIVH
jgi:hypothetical protein